jgi:hypothetical protein
VRERCADREVRGDRQGERGRSTEIEVKIDRHRAGDGHGQRER